MLDVIQVSVDFISCDTARILLLANTLLQDQGVKAKSNRLVICERGYLIVIEVKTKIANLRKRREFSCLSRNLD